MGWPQNAGCCMLAIFKSGAEAAEETFSAPQPLVKGTAKEHWKWTLTYLIHGEIVLLGILMCIP